MTKRLFVLIPVVSLFVAPSVFAQANEMTLGEALQRLSPEVREAILAEQAKIGAQAGELGREELERDVRKFLESRDTPEMRKARKNLRKETERSGDEADFQAKVLRQAAITNCDGDENIRVFSRAVGDRSFAGSYVKVRVTNPYPHPINIEDERGSLVEGLCSGGSISLFRKRNAFVDPDRVVFQYTANWVDGGRVLQGTSRSYTLRARDRANGRGEQLDTWVVRLREVSPRSR